MKIRSVNRYFAEAVKSVFRNKMMSLTSVIIVSACLLIMILMYCVTANINSMLNVFATDIRIAIFIHDDVPYADLGELHSIILEHPDVANAVFLTREENVRRWIEDGNLTPEMYEDIDFSWVQRRFDVYVADIDRVSYVGEWFKSPEMVRLGVDAVNTGGDIVLRLGEISRTISTVSFVIIAVLTVLSVVIITNTIRLTIDGRKNEISIMKFIGATNHFIRGPFLLEGMMLAVIGTAISILLVVIFYDRLINIIVSNFLAGIPRVTLLSGFELFPVLIPAALLIGALLGILSSVFTIRRYLDV